MGSKAAEVFCERWTALVLRDLGAGVSRFSDLQRGRNDYRFFKAIKLNAMSEHARRKR